MKFTSTFSLLFLNLYLPLARAATTGSASADARCIEVCCDGIAVSAQVGVGNIGINCHRAPSGDCLFQGQFGACCDRIGAIGSMTAVGTGVGCH